MLFFLGRDLVFFLFFLLESVFSFLFSLNLSFINSHLRSFKDIHKSGGGSWVSKIFTKGRDIGVSNIWVSVVFMIFTRGGGYSPTDGH